MTAGTHSVCPATERAGDRPMSEMPFGGLLRRALAGGAAAGAVAALVSWLLVGPPIRAALAVEEARGGAGGGHEEAFSRGVQVIGGMLAVLLLGLVLGVIFAVVFARLRPRLPGRGDYGRCVTLAVAGFVVVSLLPAIKYPANPPGVGDPETIGSRTAYYLTFLVAAILVAAVLWSVYPRILPGRPSSWRATVFGIIAVACFAVLVALWPASPDPLPSDVPAGLIWEFRLGSLAELAALWATLGVTTGLLLEGRPASVAGPQAAGRAAGQVAG
jgi:predicted cobalt transporter CbtA